MSNTTNINGLSSSLPYSPTPSNMPAQGFGFTANTANNLGYGIGRAIRGAFDSLWNTWQKMSTPAPSAEEIAQQRNYLIYQGGLKKCVKQLGPALANLQMNPKDRGALKKVEQLSAHFARYLKPSHEENLRELQNKILKPLEERVSSTAHLHLKKDLRKWMPVFFQGNNSMNEKEQVERQSQVMQEFSAPFNSAFEMNCPQGVDRSFHYPCQLANDVRSVCNYLDAGLSRLFSIFPAVSAESVEPAEHEVVFLEKDDQNLKTGQVETAFRAYVTSAINGDIPGFVSVIDTITKTVVSKVTVGIYPERIVITPNSHYAYVTNYKSHTVSVIDTYSNNVTATVKVSGQPSDIAITPDGFYAYVAISNGTNIINVIDTYSNRVVNNVTVDTPTKIAITPNGLYAYVTGSDQDIVSVIETTNNTVLTKIDVGSYPSGIAITPDGLYVYVANVYSKTISVINTISNAVIANVTLAFHHDLIAITPNGLYAYVTCSEESIVSVIATTNNTVLDQIDVEGKTSYGIAITPDGLHAYAANSGKISIIDTTSNGVETTITLDKSLGSTTGGIAIGQIPTPPTKNNIGLIIVLSAGGAAFVVFLVVGGYLIVRRLKEKEEDPAEFSSLVSPLSAQQQMVFL